MEARDAAERPIVHRTATTTKISLPPDVPSSTTVNSLALATAVNVTCLLMDKKVTLLAAEAVLLTTLM